MRPYSRILGRSEAESDALRELANVAFSHAATALSSLVGRRVDLAIPSLSVASTREVEGELAGAGSPLCVITLRILGERQGTLMLLFEEEDAVALADLLSGESRGTHATLTRASEEVLGEVANIMSGSALLAMYRFLRVSLIHATPVMRLRAERAFTPSAQDLLPDTGLCIRVETEFVVEGRAARGQMVIALADLEFFLDALSERAEAI